LNACLYKQGVIVTIWLEGVSVALRTAANAAGTLGPAVGSSVTLSSPCWTSFTFVYTYQTPVLFGKVVGTVGIPVIGGFVGAGVVHSSQ